MSERLRRLALAGDDAARAEWYRWLDRRAERCAQGEGECALDMSISRWSLRRIGMTPGPPSGMDEVVGARVWVYSARCGADVALVRP